MDQLGNLSSYNTFNDLINIFNENMNTLTTESESIDNILTSIQNFLTNTLKTTILNLTYPVGSIWISEVNTNPSEIIGGTWEAYAQGKFLAGYENDSSIYFKTIGDAPYGSIEHKHSLENAYVQIGAIGGQGAQIRIVCDDGGWPIYADRGEYGENNGVEQYRAHYLGVTDSGDDNSYSNYGTPVKGNTENYITLPPYSVVYMFKRTA